MTRKQPIGGQGAEISGLYAFQIVTEDTAVFLGETENHILLRTGYIWQCDCEVFALNRERDGQGICSHTLALEPYLVAACR